MPRLNIADFVRESNRIEGILRDPTDAEIEATETFILMDAFNRLDVAELATIYAGKRGALRVSSTMNVRVGSHVAPPGGAHIVANLDAICTKAHIPDADPWRVHVDYETLHPFMDGNGRTGRAIWAWMMHRRGGFPLGFLHHFYYQTLQRLGR